MAWIQTARPKTLIASLSPTLIASTYCFAIGKFSYVTFLFTLLAALFLQIGINFANDYGDFVKGADTQARKGPTRATAAGLLSLPQMKRATALMFFLSALFFSYLIFIGGIPIALFAILYLVLGFAYTAGPFPIAYLGLGELFVFALFGPVATALVTMLQFGNYTPDSLILGIGPGALASCILITNNIRDVDEDRTAHKKTLAVRFGIRFSRFTYMLFLALALLPSLLLYRNFPFISIAMFTLLAALPLAKKLYTYQDPRELNPVLGKTGMVLWLYTLVTCIGLAAKI